MSLLRSPGCWMGWGLHPPSLGHEMPWNPWGCSGSNPGSARALNPHGTGTSPCHASPGPSLPCRDIRDCARARWGPEGRGDPVLPRAFPKAPSSKHLPAIPASHSRRKRVGVWGALGARKPRMGRGEGSAPRRKKAEQLLGRGLAAPRDLFVPCRGQHFMGGGTNSKPRTPPVFQSQPGSIS